MQFEDIITMTMMKLHSLATSNTISKYADALVKMGHVSGGYLDGIVAQCKSNADRAGVVVAGRAHTVLVGLTVLSSMFLLYVFYVYTHIILSLF